MNNPDEAKQKFEAFFANKTAATKGRVFVLDITTVKDKVADRWERLSSQVYATTEDVMRHRIQSTDIFYRWDETKYLLAFGTLDEARARIKINLIAQEISQRLLGAKDQEEVIKVSMADTDEAGQFLWGTDTDPSKLLQEDSDVQQSAQKAAKGAKDDGLVKGDVGFVFRPLWFVKNKIISSYFCIPVRAKGDGRFVSGYDVLVDSMDPAALEALDLLAMKRIHHEALVLEKVKNPALLTVPIHFESIASSGRRSVLLEQCKRNLAPHRNRIVVELTHLPEGIPQSRLQALIQALKPFARSIMARFDTMHRDFGGYRNIGLHAVGVDLYNDRRDEQKIIKDMEGFAESAGKFNLHTYVHGVRSISLTTAAICAGIDYVDGYAITDVQEGAKDVQYYSIRMPYDAKYTDAKE